jgi:hypothetical protein
MAKEIILYYLAEYATEARCPTLVNKEKFYSGGLPSVGEYGLVKI